MPFTPDLINGECNWFPDVMYEADCWQYELDNSDIAHIDSAVSEASELKTEKQLDISLNNGDLAEKFKKICDELENGCGFVRLRGLPLDRWSQSIQRKIWQAMAGLVGQPVFQNYEGQLLREIRAESGDVGSRYGQLASDEGAFLSSRARTASNAELRFHTDRCDIVGLLCTGQAKTGGLSLLASSVTVHNEMLKRYPSLCSELYKPLPRSRIGEEQGGDSLWYNLPVFGVRDNKFSSHYSRTYVEALEHVPNAPKVSEMQWQALDKLAELAKENALAMHLQPGDIQFINNHVIYHARSAFEDDSSTNQVRCLLRIWLTAPHRSLPEDHKILWREVEAGLPRGGIEQSI